MKLVCASFGLEMELLENYVTVLVVGKCRLSNRNC